MKVRFGTSWLAPGGIEGVSGLTINGQQVNDPIQYYRAAATSFRPRGLRSDSITFSVTRVFDSPEEAERFVATAFNDLPQQGDLYLFCGYTEDQVVLYTAAVVDQVTRSYAGECATVQFSLSAGMPQTDAPAPDVIEPTSEMLKRGTPDITSGADSIDVVFSTPFASTPVVVVGMQCPSGGDVISARVRDGTVTTDGFTADLSAPTPGTGYKLPYIASA